MGVWIVAGLGTVVFGVYVFYIVKSAVKDISIIIKHGENGDASKTES